MSNNGRSLVPLGAAVKSLEMSDHLTHLHLMPFPRPSPTLRRARFPLIFSCLASNLSPRPATDNLRPMRSFRLPTTGSLLNKPVLQHIQIIVYETSSGTDLEGQ